MYHLGKKKIDKVKCSVPVHNWTKKEECMKWVNDDNNPWPLMGITFSVERKK